MASTGGPARAVRSSWARSRSADCQLFEADCLYREALDICLSLPTNIDRVQQRNAFTSAKLGYVKLCLGDACIVWGDFFEALLLYVVIHVVPLV